MPHVDARSPHQQRAWAAGDFSIVATSTTIVGERLCENVDLRAGERVLDIATGSENTALAAARRYCDVVGVRFIAQMQRVAARYAPAPPLGFQAPGLWGTEERLRELLDDGVEGLSLTRQTFVMRHPSIEQWLEFTRTYFGPLRQILESLDDEQQRAITGEVADLARRFNRSGDRTMAVPADYLEVVAGRR